MHKLTTPKTVSSGEWSYLTLETLVDIIPDTLKELSLLQIRSGLATATESEAGATRIISEDDLAHESQHNTTR